MKHTTRKTATITLAMLVLASCTSLQEKELPVKKDIAEAIAMENRATGMPDEVPEEYLTPSDHGGRIERITYPSKDYFGDSGAIEKNANIYLPEGYDATRRYPVLYLMHGIGGDENEWGMVSDSSFVKMMMDALVARGEIAPFIVVTPNGRSSRNNRNAGSDYHSFYEFGKELRNDLIPWMDSHYATMADRDHRAMAGLSMGGMQTINIGLCESLDLVSWFGAFSAAPTSYPDREILHRLEAFPDLEIRYFYSICGLEDTIAFAPASGAAKHIADTPGRFEKGRNYRWQEVHGGHDFQVWHLGFFNFARIVFRQD